MDRRSKGRGSNGAYRGYSRRRRRRVRLNKHHRLPRSRGGGNGRNVIKVDEELHRAYHRLFGNRTAPEIAELLSKVWIDPDYEMIAIRRN